MDAGARVPPGERTIRRPLDASGLRAYERVVDHHPGGGPERRRPPRLDPRQLWPELRDSRLAARAGSGLRRRLLQYRLTRANPDVVPARRQLPVRGTPRAAPGDAGAPHPVPDIRVVRCESRRGYRAARGAAKGAG